jgi:hypothetical protein
MYYKTFQHVKSWRNKLGRLLNTMDTTANVLNLRIKCYKPKIMVELHSGWLWPSPQKYRTRIKMSGFGNALAYCALMSITIGECL